MMINQLGGKDAATRKEVAWIYFLFHKKTHLTWLQSTFGPQLCTQINTQRSHLLSIISQNDALKSFLPLFHLANTSRSSWLSFLFQFLSEYLRLLKSRTSYWYFGNKTKKYFPEVLLMGRFYRGVPQKRPKRENDNWKTKNLSIILFFTSGTFYLFPDILNEEGHYLITFVEIPKKCLSSIDILILKV